MTSLNNHTGAYQVLDRLSGEEPWLTEKDRDILEIYEGTIDRKIYCETHRLTRTQLRNLITTLRRKADRNLPPLKDGGVGEREDEGMSQRWDKESEPGEGAAYAKDRVRSFSLSESGNQAQSTTDFVQGIPEFTSHEKLLDYCGVDRNVYSLDKFRLNSIPFNMGGGVVESHLQIRADLLKKSPEPLQFPPIQPLQIEIPKSKTHAVSAGPGNRTRTLHITDLHIGFDRDCRSGTLTPYHDRRLFSIIFQLCQMTPFDRVVLGGDLLDLAEWSDRFFRSREMRWTTQLALIELGWFLGTLRILLPHAVIDYIEGNHEARLPRAVSENLDAAFGLRKTQDLLGYPILSVPSLLDLEPLKIRWVGGYPDGELFIREDMAFIHGNVVGGQLGGTVSKVAANAQYSVAMGHIHRREHLARSLHTAQGPHVIEVYCPGCGCRVDGVVPAHKKSKINWQQGFSIIDLYEGEAPHISIIPVNNGSAVAAGELFRGEDTFEQMVAESSWQDEFSGFTHSA